MSTERVKIYDEIGTNESLFHRVFRIQYYTSSNYWAARSGKRLSLFIFCNSNFTVNLQKTLQLLIRCKTEFQDP